MKAGFRIEGQLGNGRSVREVKNLWEYTANDIKKTGVWMTDKEPNADALTRKGDSFDLGLKRAKMVMSLAVPEKQMMVAPFTEKQFIEKYIINWYHNSGASIGQLWRMVLLHHVDIKRVTFKQIQAANASYYEVVMKVEANVDYLNGDGTTPQ